MSPEELKAIMNDVVNSRFFQPDPVPAGVLGEVLEAFRLAPSLANTQPWEIIAIDQTRRQAAAAATLDLLMSPGSFGGQGWVAGVPILLAVCVDRPRAEGRIGKRGYSLAAQDTFAAIQNARLMAVALGLKSAICKEVDPDRLRDALGLPWNVDPLWLVALGYSDTPLEYPPRLKREHFVHDGEMGKPWSE